MPIAIHINTLPGQTDPSLRHFLQALFQEWTADAAGHQFLLIGQKKENSLSHLSSNNCSWQEAPAKVFVQGQQGQTRCIGMVRSSQAAPVIIELFGQFSRIVMLGSFLQE